MAQQNLINGETFLSHRNKINANFTELYNCSEGVYNRANMYLSASATLTFTASDTYYKLSSSSFSGTTVSGFDIASTGTVTYTADSTATFIFAGISDYQVDQACTVTYALFKNGILVPGAETPHVFTNQNQITNISIVAMIPNVNENDYFDIYMKCNNAGASMTANTLSILFS